MSFLKALARVFTFGYIYLVVPFLLMIWGMNQIASIEMGVSLPALEKYSEYGQYIPDPKTIRPAILKNPTFLVERTLLLRFEMEQSDKERMAPSFEQYRWQPIGTFTPMGLPKQIEWIRRMKNPPPARVVTYAGPGKPDKITEVPAPSNRTVHPVIEDLSNHFEKTYALVKDDYARLKEIDADIEAVAQDVAMLDTNMSAASATPAQRESFNTATRALDKEANDLMAERNVVARRIIMKQQELHTWLTETRAKYPDPMEGAMTVELIDQPAKPGEVQVTTAVTKPTTKTQDQKLPRYILFILPFGILIAVHMAFVSKDHSFSFFTAKLLKIVGAALTLWILYYAATRYVPMFAYLPMLMMAVVPVLGKFTVFYAIGGAISLWAIWDEYTSSQSTRNIPLSPPQA